MAKDSFINSLGAKIEKDGMLSIIDTENTFAASVIPFGTRTGVPMLDLALGRPGWPAGRIVELYGFEGCLAGSSYIQYSILDKNEKVQNSKGGTLENLYNRFNNIERKGRGYYQRSTTKDSIFMAPSVNEEGRIIRNRINSVIKTGEKECFNLKTSLGYEVIATKDHKFYTGIGFKSLEELNPGDQIFIHNGTRFKSSSPVFRQYRKEVLVKYHPFSPSKIIENKYEYKRLKEYRAIYEAAMNNLTLEEYLYKLNNNEHDLKFLDPKYHIHHLNENPLDNSLGNLAPIERNVHGQLHALENHNNLRYEATPDTVFTISLVGTQPTYDISMSAPFNNYVANNIIVHNCGKTTLGLHALKEVQRLGGIAVFIDSEMTFDPIRAAQIGVSTENRGDSFIHMEAKTLEAGFRAINKITETIKETGLDRPVVIVYDSVTGSNLEYNINKEVEIGVEGRIGQEARSIRTSMRTINANVAEAKVTLILINHAVAANITGSPYAKKSQAAGGHAIKLFASTRCELKKSGKIKDADKTHLIGAKTKILLEKSKVGGISTEEVDIDLLNTKGFDTAGNLLEAMIATEMILWPASKRSGTLQFIDVGRTITKDDWPIFLQSAGGLDEVYGQWIEWCLDKGFMLSYSKRETVNA